MIIEDILKFRQNCINDNSSNVENRFIQEWCFDPFRIFLNEPLERYLLKDTVSGRTLDITEYIESE